MTAQTKLLAGLLALAASFGFGAYLGYQYADGQNAKGAAKAQAAVIESAREAAITDKAQAIERARREEAAAEAARTVYLKGVADANVKAMPACDRDDVSFSLLIDALRVANGAEANAGSLPEAVHAGPGAIGPDGRGDPDMGVRDDRRIWRLSAASCGMCELAY